MRKTKVIAFSAAPEFEEEIQKQAKAEHRTTSEFIREAVRQYMARQEFEETRKSVAKRMKKKKLSPSDVESILDVLRRRE